MDTSNKYITTVQQYADTEDYFIEIPQEIINELNWQEGDEIDWQINDQGIITLHKIKDSTMSEQQTINPHIIIKEEIDAYLNSQSEGKDYIQATNEETFGTESIELS